MKHVNHEINKNPLRRHLSRLAALLVAFSAVTAMAGPVPISNADFSNAANNGSVGGGLIGTPATTIIGAGPWYGTYSGIDLGLTTLAAPTLTIGSGNAVVSGLVYSSIVSLNNQGRFHQTLSENFTPGMRYTLSADITTNSVLSLSVLSSGNAGLALSNGATQVASSRTGTPTLQLLQGTTYRVSIDYDTPPGVIGPITAGLLAEPSGVASVGLLASVSFDNVTLQKRLTNQIPAAITPVGPTTYSAVVNTSVVPAIAVIVRDSNGDPIAGTMVNYTAPATGASLNPATGSVVTDSLGVATFTPLANTIAGTYQVVVTIPGSAVTMSFTLTNLAGPPAQIGTPTGPIPTAQIGMPLSTPVAAIVLDVFGNPVSGATVGFSAPANGPSATLSASSATTNAQGIASVTGVANLIAGNYAIATQVNSLSGSVPALNLLPATISTTRDGQPEQSADIGTEFRCLLLVRAIDDTGAPQPGLAVDFEAPASGASATLIYGMMQGTSLRVPTDVDGFAWVQARGNGVVGTYPVTALLAFSPTAVARTFVLRNLAVGDAQFSTGFDGLCARGTMP